MSNYWLSMFLLIAIILAIIYFLLFRYLKNQHLKFQDIYQYNNQKALKIQEKEELHANILKNVAHEIKGQVSIVKLNLDMLNTDISNNAILGNLNNSVDMLLYYSSNLLDMFALQNKHQTFNFEKSNIVNLIDKVIKIYPNNISYENSLDPTTEINIDHFKITQLISNIINNAIKHNVSSVPIFIGTDRIDESHVRISISDKGVGIPEKEIQKVFDPYFTSSQSFAVTSTGLGLSLCKYIVEMHKGEITVKNNKGTDGATFIITLPGWLNS